MAGGRKKSRQEIAREAKGHGLTRYRVTRRHEQPRRDHYVARQRALRLEPLRKRACIGLLREFASVACHTCARVLFAFIVSLCTISLLYWKNIFSRVNVSNLCSRIDQLLTVTELYWNLSKIQAESNISWLRLDGCCCLHRLYRTFSYCLVTYRRETESLYRRNLWNKPCFLTFEQRGICTLCCETMAKYVQSNEGKERHRKMRNNLSLFGCFKIINTTLDLLITEFGFRNLSWG